ncbi:MAG: mRNA-degrading endonuclease [Candidatus Taylorbacteria bacterium CG11_big_fil_rev_8_21_14_0_20_46_11]|uniref:mRNA-degrading endonuclease n=1 Tax=Candidatus Taylorbacteria bacterium CG11_big_fil_rev_8_21_14_0_20_46_11 TaxID=1975025 RepID=A0A2H0KDZ4_9BACT|nr:MAG: mRNA-degrading endonuclease [Candidatus Taylorbacteria bacterium CG11_big_fil_rev_8_21_14_0_20_46_11]
MWVKRLFNNEMSCPLSKYPKKGDIAWCALNPIRGHEQSGLRPCVVISGSIFNQKTGTAVVCPITSKDKKDYYFRIAIETPTVKGFVMADQIRTVDWKERGIRVDGSAGTLVLVEVYEKLTVLFDTT